MDTQSFDVTRLYYPDADACGCPRCECPYDKSIGDTWYQEIQEYDDFINFEARCALCKCEDDGKNGSYTWCKNDYYGYPIGSRSCDAPESNISTISCHSDIEAETRMYCFFGTTSVLIWKYYR